jgi:hypothetical protein
VNARFDLADARFDPREISRPARTRPALREATVAQYFAEPAVSWSFRDDDTDAIRETLLWRAEWSACPRAHYARAAWRARFACPPPSVCISALAERRIP